MSQICKLWSLKYIPDYNLSYKLCCFCLYSYQTDFKLLKIFLLNPIYLDSEMPLLFDDCNNYWIYINVFK